jgi:4-hydroxy-2-oxoheptanedioate aldolase
MPIPSLRDLWSDHPVLGAWMFLREPMTAEAAARLGYDYVVVDLQHGIASGEESLAMMQAAEAAGAIPVCRVATNQPVNIGHALDAGALAVIVPLVNTGEDARRAADAARYAPVGSRSFGPVAAVSRYSAEYAQVANERICLLVMIETAEALTNLDEILSTPGIDGVYVGTFDLSLSLGLTPGPYNDAPVFLEAIDAILAACERHGVVPGIHSNEEIAPLWIERGFRLVTVGYDQYSVLDGLRGALETSRGSAASGPGSSGYR